MIAARCFWPVIWTGLTLTLFGASACQQTEPSQAKIIGGQLLPTNAGATVALLRPDSQGVIYSACTGVLIAPKQVLTAAHCSRDADGVYQPEQRWVVAGTSSPEKSAARLNVASIAIHPGFDAAQMASGPAGVAQPAAANDLAVWTLAEPVVGVTPAAVVAPTELDAIFRDQQMLVIQGYGRQSSWESPWDEHLLASAETPYHQNVTLSVSRKVHEGGRLITRRVDLAFAGRTAGEFYAGGPGFADTCKGDSGGPAYVRDASGTLRVIGITSRGASSCDSGGVYTLVPAFKDWLEHL